MLIFVTDIRLFDAVNITYFVTSKPSRLMPHMLHCSASFLCMVINVPLMLNAYNIQLLPLREGDMTICSPEACNSARG